MAACFHIEEDRITIKPLAFLKPVGITLVAFFLLMPLVMLLILFKGDAGKITLRHLAPFMLLLPFVLACVPLLVYSGKTLIFDKPAQTISSRIMGRSRVLLSFDEAGAIVLMTSVGMYYRLKSKKDRYGKGYRISPYFQSLDKEKKEFDEKLLPAIDRFFKSLPAPAPGNTAYSILDPETLKGYRRYREGYRLHPANSYKQYLPGLIICLLVLLYFWFRVLTQEHPSETERQLSCLFLLPAALLWATLSKRIYFNTATQQIIVYHLGIPFFRYHCADFSGFNIVRKTYNGFYNGTEVRLEFTKSGRVRELILKTFHKTTGIESFIQETEWVMNRKCSNPNYHI